MKLRRQHLDNEPLCRECTKLGKATVAVIVDHIIALAWGGTEHPSNKQSLCKACSDAKTAREATEGRRLTRG